MNMKWLHTDHQVSRLIWKDVSYIFLSAKIFTLAAQLEE